LSLGAFFEERNEDLRRRLQEAIARANEFCTVETLTTRGKPGHEVLRVVNQKQSDLIVMGVHSRGAADLWFFGSTTHHVVRQASCPVLTLPHP
jgi:nucleotide-binding universal stress UspA family protein